jgi:membrane protein required for colicin V production
MNWIDIVIIVLVAMAALLGFREGAVRTASGFVGLALGVFLAGRFGDSFAESVFAGQTWGKVLAYIIIFGICAVCAGILGTIISKIVKATPLGWVDRLIGIIAGALSGVVTITVIIALLLAIFPESANMVTQSWLGAILLSWSQFLLGLLPVALPTDGNLSSKMGA